MSKTKLTSTKKTPELTEAELSKTINKMSKENNALQKQLKDQLKKNTKDAVELLKQLINQTPEVVAVRWNQYTPHFNDGDECVFSVNELELKFDEKFMPKNEEDDSYTDDEGFVHEWKLEELIEHATDAINFKDISRIEAKIQLFYKVHNELQNMSDGLKETFGDHVQVIVTRKGIETEEYSHD